MAFKDLTKRWHHLDHQDDHDCRGDHQNRHRVKHCGDNLAFDLLSFLHELGQTLEYDFEHAAQFAGLDHVHVQAVENLRVLRETFGKSAATFDGQGQVADDSFQRGMLLLLFQHAQSAQ
jgi:hypothetical protein